jgi:tRNA threonylcarbamoyladenosine biosynthesis protein TsaB
MRILALETSGQGGSLAALEGQADATSLLSETSLAGAGRTAQSLAPALQKLLADVAWPARSVDLVAVVVGPGSFTGLRIGVTTAKVFAYAARAQIIGVSSLDVLAAQLPLAETPLWAVMDAQRGELFVARFSRPLAADGQPIGSAAAIMGRDQWLMGLCAGERVTGPALAHLRPLLPAGVEAAPAALWQPTASAAGQVAWRAFQQGRRDDMWSIVPMYFRPSAAEEQAGRAK